MTDAPAAPAAGDAALSANRPPASARPHVVVVGGGFAGLAAVYALRGSGARITLVDQHNHHCFTPLVYQVATAMLEPSEIAHPIRAALRGRDDVEFRLGRVTGIELEGRTVVTEHGEISYDHLVLAAGSANNYFKHPEIAEATFGINDLGEAVALRNHLLWCFERAAWEPEAAERRRLLTVAVVGGGPTGVEFAGSLAELVYGILPSDFPGLDLDEVSIQLIEGSDAPLPPFHPRLQAAAARALAKRRVQVRTGIVEAIEELDGGPSGHCADHRVRLRGGEELRAGTVVWAAGVRAVELTRNGAAPGSQGRLAVGPTLQLADHPEVLVAGDMAEIAQGEAVLPMLAPVAMQSGGHAGRVVADQIAGRPSKPFRYHAYPTMATIGRGDAVVQGKRMRASGLPGWSFWLLVHLARIAGVRARFSVVVDWSSAFVMRDRPMRLIVRPRRPDLDL